MFLPNPNLPKKYTQMENTDIIFQISIRQ